MCAHTDTSLSLSLSLSLSHTHTVFVVVFMRVFFDSVTSYNGGTCIDGINWYVCKCAKGFSGPDCRVSKCIITQHVLDRRRFADHAIVSTYSCDL